MLSIIIITKNEEKHLPRLLESIKKQDFKDYEIIVSDAASTDRTREIAMFYGCEIVEGGLPSVGRNNGAKAARGNILMFLDADGKLPPSFLKKTIVEFNRRKLGCAGCFYVPMKTNVINRMIFLVYDMLSLILQYISPHAGGYFILVRKSVFEKVGGFNEKILIAEDHNFAKKCSKVTKFRVLFSVYVIGDIRKFENKGRLKMILKYFYLGLVRIMFGDRKKPLINYELHGGVKIKRGKSLNNYG